MKIWGNNLLYSGSTDFHQKMLSSASQIGLNKRPLRCFRLESTNRIEFSLGKFSHQASVTFNFGSFKTHFGQVLIIKMTQAFVHINITNLWRVSIVPKVSSSHKVCQNRIF